MSLNLSAAPRTTADDSNAFQQVLALKDHPEQNIEIEIYKGTLPTSVLDEVNNNPQVELIEISANTEHPDLGPKMEIHSGKANFPKNWWVDHHTQLQTTWCFFRFAVATGAFYLGLVSFSQFSYPTVLAGAQLAGLVSLVYMHKNLVLNNWLTKYKNWGMRIIRYFFLAVLYVGIVKFGIVDAEIVSKGLGFIDKAFVAKELRAIAYSAFIGTITQGFWGLWNAQYQENNLKAIDKNLPADELNYRKETITMKSNFFSFLNSIVNNSLSAVIATGGNLLIIDVLTYLISGSGIVAFAKSYPRIGKCSNIAF
jgi:hypothetical protein